MKCARAAKFYAVLAAFLFVVHCSFAAPTAMYFDPGIHHQVYGVNRFPANNSHKDGNWAFDISLDPFYQHTSSARDRYGNKVPLGNRLGRWEMLAIFWEGEACPDSKLMIEAAPESKPFTEDNYCWMHTVSTDLVERFGLTDDDPSARGIKDPDGDYSVYVNYEKIGVRGTLNAVLGGGFGLAIKGGIVEYKQTPTAYENHTFADSVEGELHHYINSHIMSYTSRERIAYELGLSLDRYETTAFEDTFAQLYWTHDFKFDDNKGNHVVGVVPYISTGVWIPTGKKKDPDKMFSLASGHDGFWGVAIEGAFNFDFPDTLLFSIGGGVTFFETKTQDNQRVPNHRLQAGIYPWKTSIRRTIGPAINFNISLKTADIIDNLSFYFDYFYAKHNRDTIHISKGCPDTHSSVFHPEMLEADSYWQSSMIHAGFDYRVTPNLSFGLSGQGHLSGRQVYRTYTVMGEITFTF